MLDEHFLENASMAGVSDTAHSAQTGRKEALLGVGYARRKFTESSQWGGGFRNAAVSGPQTHPSVRQT